MDPPLPNRLKEPTIRFTTYTFDGPAGTLGGTTFGAVDAGDAPVLYIHPINADHRVWGAVAERIGRPAVLAALRGHRDAAASGPFGASEWLADLVATLDHLEVERVHAVGGSLGGTLAVLLATRYPSRVVSAASFGGTLNAEGNVDAFIEMLGRDGVAATFRKLVPVASLGPDATPQMLEQTLSMINPNEPAVVRDVLLGATATNVVDEIHPVGVPALVVCGEYDNTCPREQSQLMADRLEVPLHVIPGVGHLPMVEAPDETIGLLQTHFDAPRDT